MCNVIFRIFLFSCVSFVGIVSAQETYQKARIPLDARTIGETRVKNGPDINAKDIGMLAAESSCIVIARQGEWFEIMVRNKRGWVAFQSLQLMGPSNAPVAAIPPSGPPKEVGPTQRSTTSISTNRKTSAWSLSIAGAAGIKSIDNSFRAGLSYSFLSFQRSSFHLLLGAAVQSDKFIYAGPGFSHDLGFRFLGGRTFLLTSMPFYYLADDATTNESQFALGTQIGPQLQYGRSTKVTIGIPLESILYGATRTRISLIPTLGLIF